MPWSTSLSWWTVSTETEVLAGLGGVNVTNSLATLSSLDILIWPERGGALQHEGDSARDGGVAPVGPRHRGGGHRHRALPRVVTNTWQQVNTGDWISFLSTCRMGWGCCPWTTWRAWDSSRGWPRWCCRAAPPRRPPRRAPCPAALRQGI